MSYLALYLLVLEECPTGDIGVRVMQMVDRMKREGYSDDMIRRALVHILYNGITWNRWPRPKE
jgi:hypothetical protein